MLFRVTIALLGLALVSMQAVAASPEATLPGTPSAPEVTGSGDRAAGARPPSRAKFAPGSPLALPGPLATEPFSDTAGAERSGEAGGLLTTGGRRSENEAGPSEDAEDSEEEEQASETEGPASSLRALSCLEGEGGNDQDGARRGVQKRDFLKKRRFELSAIGGYYGADTLSSTYLYGAAVSLFPSEDFGLEVLLARNPVSFRLEDAFTSFDGERHFQSGVAWNALGAMLWSPVHAKLRWSERNITHADLMLLAGGGRTIHGSVQGLTFQMGAAMKLYLSRFVSARFEVRDLMVPQEVLGRGHTTHNLIIMVGLSVWVPG